MRGLFTHYVSGIALATCLFGCDKTNRVEKDEDFRKTRQIAQLASEVNRLTNQNGQNQIPVQTSPAVSTQQLGLESQSAEPASATEGGVGRMVKPAEFLNSQEAMTVAEVATMLRARVPAAEIVQAVKGRGLVIAIEAGDAAGLGRMGAPPDLLHELKNYDNVLTPSEYERFLGRQAQHSNEKAALRGYLRDQDADREWKESKDNARLERLTGQLQYNADRDKEEQNRQRAATAQKLERESREADWKNSNDRIYRHRYYYGY